MLRDPQTKVQKTWPPLKEGSISGKQGLPTGFGQGKACTGMGVGECGLHTEGYLGLCQEPWAPKCQEGPH